MLAKTHTLAFLAGTTCAIALALPPLLGAVETASAAAAPAATPAAPQTVFPTAEAGFLALAQALDRNDVPALRAMLGPGSDDLIASGDPVDDQNARQQFIAAYRTGSRVTALAPDEVTLSVGQDKWEFPIPMQRMANGWHFDTELGREELLTRRIGRNERNAIDASRAFVDAEHEYASADHDGDRILEYAPRFISTPGKQDGLYWPAADGKGESPLGQVFAQASAAGYTIGTASAQPVAQRPAYYGYHYQILTRQGPGAAGGAYDYMINGNMIGGFAMIAWPANYHNSGVMTFMVNHAGQVFQKDLGPETATLAPAITQFSPDRTWTRTKSTLVSVDAPKN